MTSKSIKGGLIRLRSKTGEVAMINPKGAFIESLEALGGDELVFPRQRINGRDRGGVPVCAPVFGPGTKVGLAQHGFARNLTWEALTQVEDRITFSLKSPHLQDPSLQAYADSEMQLEIAVGDKELTMNLRIANKGLDSFVVSPGFHPYFPLKYEYRAEDVKVNGVTYSTHALLESRAQKSSPTSTVLITFPDGDITIRSSSLVVPVVWSADAEQYICVEPTNGGPVAAENSQSNLNEYMCNSGEEKQYSMTIKWGE